MHGALAPVKSITPVIVNNGCEYYSQLLPNCRDRGIHVPVFYSQNVSNIIISV